MKHIKLLSALFLLIYSQFINAQPVGNGSYGSPSFTLPSYVINDTRAAVASIGVAGAGSTDLTLSFTGTVTPHTHGSWAAGQKVLVILMHKSGGALPTRNWQMTTVTGVNGSPVNSINVTPFAHTNWITSGHVSKIQVIMVPQYFDVTIPTGTTLTCPAWDGYTGGVLAFTASNDLTINSGAWLNVAGKGFENYNTGGTGGAGGPAPAAQAINPTLPGFDGVSGNIINFPIYSLGQGECYRGMATNVIPGGRGGAGGYTAPGSLGTIGSNPNTRGVLPKSKGPKLLMLGNAGKQGKGGSGGHAGGNGGNGGNGFTPGLQGSPYLGSAGTSGGKGGNGGKGGGIIICFATNIIAPSGTQCIDISATNGGAATNGVYGGGGAGDGGDGGDGNCDWINGLFHGYGAGGIRGLTGNGASGGSGGNGGSIGSFSIRTPVAADNDLTLANIKYTVGAGGAAGLGAFAMSPANDGADGCPTDDLMACSGQSYCIKRNYNVYNCAGYEAFQVLGDMDRVYENDNYIKFTKSSGSTTLSKKSGNKITSDEKYYFCIYYKCSKLLVAYEDDDEEANATTETKCGINAYNALQSNVYWVKFKNNACQCDNIFTTLAEIMRGVGGLGYTHKELFSPMVEGGLTYQYGYVNIGSLFRYEDYDNSGSNGGFFLVSNPGNRCEKDCDRTSGYKIEWSNLSVNTPCPCSPGAGGPGPGLGGPNIEIYPTNIPYVPEMWDNPDPGDDGDPGEPGEGDDDAISLGEFDLGDEDGMSEFTGPTGLANIPSVGYYFAISPNPTGNQLTLTVKNSPNLTAVDMRIYDISGKLVWSNAKGSVSNNIITQDITSLNPGTYFVQLKTQHMSEILKFVKQ